MPPKLKSFDELATAAGLKEPAVTALKTEDFDSIEAIKAMRDEDAAALSLTRGQFCLLEKWREALRVPMVPKTSEQVAGSSSASQVPAAKSSEMSARDISSLLAGLQVDSGKALTKVPRPYQHIAGEDYKRPSEVRSLPELMSGALNILEAAAVEKTAPDIIVAMIRHVSFIAQKAAQRYTTESLVAYDDAVRDKVEKNSGIWPMSSDMDLCNRLLRVHETTNHRRGAPTSTDRRENTSQDKQPCIRFNQTECKISQCRYEHICLICSEPHAMTTCPSKMKPAQ